VIKKRMKKSGASDPDAVIRLALETMEEMEAEPLETLDRATQAAIMRGWEQAERGEVRPWHEVRSELRALVARKRS